MKPRTVISMEETRDLTITLQPVSGGVTLFYAFVNGVRVIQADGTKKRTWTGKIPDAQVRIKIRVVGVDNASFRLGIDLPGTADDQNLTLQLQEGYYEAEFII